MSLLEVGTVVKFTDKSRHDVPGELGRIEAVDGDCLVGLCYRVYHTSGYWKGLTLWDYADGVVEDRGPAPDFSNHSLLWRFFNTGL